MAYSAEYMCIMYNAYISFSGNTKVITQSALQRFQDEMGKAMKDPYKVQLDSVTHTIATTVPV